MLKCNFHHHHFHQKNAIKYIRVWMYILKSISSLFIPCRILWSVSVLMGERVPKPLKITESLPKKSAVRPVYSSPPDRERKSIGSHCRQLNSQSPSWEKKNKTKKQKKHNLFAGSPTVKIFIQSCYQLYNTHSYTPINLDIVNSLLKSHTHTVF